MSPFNFETFGAGHIPPFRFKAQPRQTIISDDIEDVEYVDVSDPQPEPKAKRTYDKAARYAEILAYAYKKADEFMKEKENRLSIGRINGVEIYAVIDEKGLTLVPIKPICQAIGIDFEGQRQRIQRDRRLSSVAFKIKATGTDGKLYDMLCLPLQYTYGWLFSIESSMVAPNAHFHGRATRLQEFVDIERQLMERRETLQNSLSELMKSDIGQRSVTVLEKGDKDISQPSPPRMTTTSVPSPFQGGDPDKIKTNSYEYDQHKSPIGC